MSNNSSVCDLKDLLDEKVIKQFEVNYYNFQGYLDNLKDLEMNSLQLKEGYIPSDIIESDKELQKYFSLSAKIIFEHYNKKREDLALTIEGTKAYIYDYLVATMINISLRNSLVYCEKGNPKISSLHSIEVLREVTLSVSKYFIGNFLNKVWVLTDRNVQINIARRCMVLQKSLIEAKEGFVKVYDDVIFKEAVKEAFFE